MGSLAPRLTNLYRHDMLIHMESYGYVLYVYGDKHLIEMSFYHQLMYGSFISTKVHIWSDVFIWMDSSFPDAGFHVH